jgi:hypothetical protein
VINISSAATLLNPIANLTTQNVPAVLPKKEVSERYSKEMAHLKIAFKTFGTGYVYLTRFGSSPLMDQNYQK